MREYYSSPARFPIFRKSPKPTITAPSPKSALSHNAYSTNWKFPRGQPRPLNLKPNVAQESLIPRLSSEERSH
jgi:hypothetical protein